MARPAAIISGSIHIIQRYAFQSRKSLNGSILFTGRSVAAAIATSGLKLLAPPPQVNILLASVYSRGQSSL